ncbi:hypothetical protein GOODEAATRI_025729, partial [Goodea atripinnis]
SSLQNKELTFVETSSSSLGAPTPCMTYLNGFVMSHGVKGLIARLVEEVVEREPV